MAVRTKPPFRADHVGSLLRPPALLRAREDAAAGRITADELHRVEDEAIAASSTARSPAWSIVPSASSARARSSSGGRRRLPTWSARNGGFERGVIGCPPLDSFGRWED